MDDPALGDDIPHDEGEDGEEGDYFDDNINDPQHLPADHELMIRAQVAFQKQLRDEHERVDLQLRERDETLKKIKKQREEIGVQLYSVQQQLAKMQMNFERTHDNYDIVQKCRVEAEENLESINQIYEKKKQEVEDQLKKVNKTQEELNQLNRTLKQVQQYNQQMRDEIQVTRGTTYRAEENVSQIEKDKRKQDLLIDSINEQIKSLNERKALYQAQITSQREETEAATQTLKEAAEEMEKIQQSKKTLLDDWQKSLLGMQRRDKALQAIREELTRLDDSHVQVDSEINGYRLSIRKEHERSEQLKTNFHKIEGQIEFLRNQIEENTLARQKLEAQYDLLKKSLGSTETESQRLDTEKASIENHMVIVEKNIMKLHTETKALMEDIMNNLSQQTTVEKSAINLVKQAGKINNAINEKEAEKQNVENEIARVKIDVLNTQTQNELLGKKRDELTKEFNQNKEELDKKEVDINRTHDEIQKKQRQVDVLNRKHAELQKDLKDENTGPLQATIKNLKNSISEQGQESENLEKEWIKKQTEYVNHQNKLTVLQGDCNDLKSKNAVYEQKKIRLAGIHAQHSREIADLRKSLKQLRTEMNKLNELYSKNIDQKGKLNNENFNLEKEFIQRLKEMEGDSVNLESQIEAIKEEKANILTEIVEQERQILLWERKFQLEKEMQEALDPDIGQTEMKAMKKEIHRMELRYEQLRKKQEELIKEIERAIAKRETIQLKYLPKTQQRTGKGKGGSSQSQVSRQVSTLKTTLKHTTQNANQIDVALQQRQDEVEKIGREIQNAEEAFDALQQDIQQEQIRLTVSKLQKHQNLFKILTMQSCAKSYSELADGTFKFSAPRDNLDSLIQDQQAQVGMIQDVISIAAQENNEFAPVLQKIMAWDA
mmetsp:Transcript_3849/g.4213  ORF Transcript_3849/g.4213 Transcript_3849/m.4213 type:complete len:890 (+) Transcript_3849:56-2725(+)